MYILGPNTPEQGAMPSHIVFHTVWQDLAIGIEEVTDHEPVSSLDCSHILQTFCCVSP